MTKWDWMEVFTNIFDHPTLEGQLSNNSLGRSFPGNFEICFLLPFKFLVNNWKEYLVHL